MASKIILIASGAVLAGSAVFGALNRQMYIDQKTVREDVEIKLKKKKEVVDTTKNELQDAEETLKDLKLARDKVRAELTNLESELGGKEKQFASASKELESSNKKLEELAPLLAKFEALDPAELKKRLEDAKQGIVDRKADLEKINADIATTNRSVESNNTRITGFVEMQTNRRESIASNAFEATVTAVNPEYGFVIINAGKNRNIQPDKTLLVVQGGRRIAKLNILRVEGNTTVADVVSGSLSPGAFVQPGQQVIYESVSQ